MKYWNRYTALVKFNCASFENVKDLAYWRNNLFARGIIYLLPFCMIGLLPGVYLSFISRLYIVGAVDLLAAIAMMVVALMPGISQPVRKIIFITCLYLLSLVLLYYLGLSGPGLVYLLAACIISILIFPTSYTFWPAWLNTFICFLFGAAVSLGITPWSKYSNHSPTEWIGVSSNLVFLSFLFSALIPRLFSSLQETLNKEKKLQEELNKERQSLEQVLNMLQEKNDELKQFAYVASHDLKEPLRMVTAFMGLLKTRYSEQLDEDAHI
ncbi:MAG: hypothetical protein ABI707_07280 [Ferruginibacter sp.]